MPLSTLWSAPIIYFFYPLTKKPIKADNELLTTDTSKQLFVFLLLLFILISFFFYYLVIMVVKETKTLKNQDVFVFCLTTEATTCSTIQLTTNFIFLLTTLLEVPTVRFVLRLIPENLRSRCRAFSYVPNLSVADRVLENALDC